MENISLRDFILKYGLFTGLILILLSLISYILGIEWMVSFTFAALNFIVLIGAPVYAGILWKKKHGGYLDFKNAFIVILLVFAASNFVLLGYNVIMFTVIDPQVPELAKDALADKTFSLMERFGVSEEDIEKAMEEIEKTEMEYTPASLIKGYFSSLIWGAIIALIGAAIIKKNKPLFIE